MSRDKQRLLDYLEHILKAIENIESYCSEIDEIQFLENSLYQDAVVRNFEVVGEACNNICKHYPEFAEQNNNIPFGSAYEMRNALAHGYFKIDYELVWKTIHRELPELYQKVASVKFNYQNT
ncbi:HepT-like ribonuclease domain-containing protein [Catenovulum adriaticum]|uniref:DUF86 domain-containing protein n=1 Tax=Catenovulum adriaticum TaxID=2984846 RepID=A0ABY7AIF8_9ALTE|nr:DUF86 domain-containing protein [Catenovulum sp. TS8]WAJ69388.1 DUF86 domain-containing protein [Catenovulum sp. TS8]